MNRFVLFFIFAFPFVCPSQVNSIVRGPYLQQTGTTSTYICWKTNSSCNSKVLYGNSKNNLSSISYLNNSDTLHFNFITGLLPDTKYYYTVNKDNSTVNSDTFYFYTAPPVGSGKKIRFLALGDCGSGFAQQYNVKDAINFYNKSRYVNGILLLGDNAYTSGMQTEYQTGFFDPYKSNFIFNNSCIYAAPGNHDYGNDYTFSVNHQVPYYEVFKAPENAELGGVPSNHKEFYSYNYANAHFISLDSYGIEQGMYHLWDSLGPQYQWLEQDLQQDKSMWKIVYFHHPPFTMGSHNSDTEADLVSIRQNIARLLEKYGVDLVINGHSHNYERSWLQKGHYGLESTFNKTIHTLDTSSAQYDGSLNSCPYKKDTADNTGTVYIIAGASGKLGITQSTYPHDSKYFSDSYRGGALFLEIEGNRLDAYYLEEDSLIHDQFTIFKNVNRHQNITVFSNQSAMISASWNGTYNWNFNNANTKSQTVAPSLSSQYIVNDSLNCLADTFTLIIPGVREYKSDDRLILYPNPSKEKLFLEFPSMNGEVEYSIVNTYGQAVCSSKTSFLKGKTEVNLSHIPFADHMYWIILNISEKQVAKPFFIER